MSIATIKYPPMPFLRVILNRTISLLVTSRVHMILCSYTVKLTLLLLLLNACISKPHLDKNYTHIHKATLTVYSTMPIWIFTWSIHHTTTITVYLNEIFQATSQGYHLYTYLDFRKAFDSVPHSKLLTKLSQYGITGSLWYWFSN